MVSVGKRWGQSEKNEKKGTMENFCQLFKTCSKSFCCITLLTSCKRKHIMHANWLQQQQIATSDGANGFLWKFLLCLSAWIFQCPLENKQCHTVHSWSDSGTKVYQWSFCQIKQLCQDNGGAYKVFWNYSATNHGKGAVDSFGGTTKEVATQVTSSNQKRDHQRCSFNV